ncbi:MAG: ATP-binding protein [Bryobacterales bacterium]|nr:ATP-binding protein [Bryobacterales bacterium]
MSAGCHVWVEAEMAWLRALLERRSAWLRSLWKHDRDEDWKRLVIADEEADIALSGALSLEREWSYYREKAEAQAAGARIEALRRDADAQRGPDLPASRLARLFGLSPFGEAALVACLAPEWDPSFSTLYGYVQDDIRRRFPTAHLLLALFASPENVAACHAELGDGGPLMRYRLLEAGAAESAGSPAAARPLLLAPGIAHYLLGSGHGEPRLASILRGADSGWRGTWVEEAAERVLSRAGNAARINLTGPANAAKELIAAAVAGRMGRRLMVLDPARLPGSETERLDLYRLLDREVRLASLACYVPPQEPESGAARLAAEAAECLEGPIFLDSTERLPAPRPMAVVPVSSPSRSQQKAIWRQALENANQRVDGALDSLVQQFDFSPATIRDAVEEASLPGSVQPSNLWQICRRVSGWKLEDLAQRITPHYGWEDIVLGADEMRQLREIAAQVGHRARVYEEWGFAARLSRGRGISALFSGPSGTGKTMAAEILAKALELDLYVIDLAGVVSKYIGETEKNLRRVFDAAEQSGAILFFDEADALFGKRSEVRDSHDRYANIEVNYLLQKMEQYQGLAILSTNRRSALDKAFSRRLRFLVDFPFPSRENRELIWRKTFPRQAPLEDVDFSFLARLEIAGGNIRNIAVNAAFLASAEGGAIQTGHIMRAVRQEYAKIDKLVTEAEFGPHYRGKE